MRGSFFFWPTVSINKINQKLFVFEYYNCTCIQVHEQQNMECGLTFG